MNANIEIDVHAGVLCKGLPASTGKPSAITDPSLRKPRHWQLQAAVSGSDDLQASAISAFAMQY